MKSRKFTTSLVFSFLLIVCSSCTITFNKTDFSDEEESGAEKVSEIADSGSSSTVFLYSVGYTDGSLHAVSADTTTGELSSIATYSMDGNSSLGLVRNPSGTCIWAGGGSTSTEIEGFSVNQTTGALTPVATGSVTKATRLMAHPTLSILYAGLSSTLRIYQMNSNCTLTQLNSITYGTEIVTALTLLNDYLFVVTHTSAMNWDETYAYSINPATGALSIEDSDINYAGNWTARATSRQGASSNAYQIFTLISAGGFYRFEFDSSGPTMPMGTGVLTATGYANDWDIQFGPDNRLYIPTGDYLYAATLNPDGSVGSSVNIDLPGVGGAWSGGPMVFHSQSLIFMASGGLDKLYSFTFSADTLTEMDNLDVGSFPYQDLLMIDPN